MSLNRKKAVLTLIVSIIVFFTLHSITYAYAFKDISNVNAYAKGNAITGAKIGLDGIHKNQASLDSVEELTIISSYSSHFQMATVSQMGIAFPFSKFKVGFNLPIKYISNIPLTVANDNQGQQVGSFSDLQCVGMTTVSTKVNQRISVGMNVNVYAQKLYNQRALGVGIDVGALIDNKNYQVGISLQDITNTSIKWSTGYVDKLLPRINIGIRKDTKFGGTLFVDSTVQSNTPYVGNIGYEHHLADTFKVSLGLSDVTRVKKVTCGTTLILDSFEVNYSFSQLETTGSSHNLGVTINQF